jgi:recombination protein RecA
VRIDIRKVNTIKEADGTVLGNRTKIKVVKNKVAPPFAECEFDILYNQGIAREGSLIDLAIDLGVMEKKGAWFYHQGNQIAQGRDAAQQVLRTNPDLYEKILSETKEKMAAVKK